MQPGPGWVTREAFGQLPSSEQICRALLAKRLSVSAHSTLKAQEAVAESALRGE